MDGRDLFLFGIGAAAIWWLLSQTQSNSGALSGLGNEVNDLGGYVDQSFNTFENDTLSADSTSGDADVMARTIRGEAANQTAQAKQGVASVIMNRAKDIIHYPAQAGSITAICKQPGQFDCWSASLGSQSDYALTTSAWTGSANDVECRQIAQEMIAGTLGDNTAGAEFYHDVRLGGPPSAWGNVVETANYDDLTFYRRA